MPFWNLRIPSSSSPAIPTIATLLCLVALTCATPAWAADEPADGDEEVASEEVPAALPPGSNLREVEELEALEEADLRAHVLGEDSADAFDATLLGPHTGTLTALQRDTGLVAELQRGGDLPAPTGAALLTIPAVRKRFEQTQVLGLTEHNQPSVRAYLDFFDGRGKPILARWIERMGRYEPLLREELKKAGLPEDLVYVSMIESGFSPYAASPAAAVGLWQFIPTTGVEMGLRIDRWVDERRDPIRATKAAIKYLTYLHEKFGSWPLALAAYNGGPGLVANTVERYNTNNYWFIQRRNGMYDETRRYVPKVLAAGLVTKNADIFGLDAVVKVAPMEWEEVQVPPRTRLSLVADACGVDYDVVRDLNPHLLRGQTPPGDSPYAVRIPADKLERFVAKFDGVSASDGLEHEIHTVRFGESLAQVAERYEVPPRVLRAANGLKRGQRPAYGAELIVPKKAMGSWRPRKKGTPKVIVVPAKAMQVEGKARYYYRINEGDTLDALGQGFGINPMDLVIWNGLDPNAKLPEGMVIQVYMPQERDVSALALMPAETVKAVAMGSDAHKKLKRKKRTKRRFHHRVRSGESLWLIARKYKVTVKDLKKWNRRLRRSNLLQPGDKLVVYPGR